MSRDYSPKSDLIDKLEYEPEHHRPLDFSEPNWDKILPYLDRLPPPEYDVIYYHLRHHMSQDAVGKLLGRSQGTISTMLEKAVRRLQFMQTISDLDRDEFHADTKNILSLEFRVQMWGYYLTSNYLEISRLCKSTYSTIRDHIHHGLRLLTLANQDGEFQAYVTSFDSLIKHPGILWYGSACRRPTWIMNTPISYSDLHPRGRINQLPIKLPRARWTTKSKKF